MKEKNLNAISKLLNDFGNFINNRSIVSLVVAKETFPKILEWHFKVWQKEQAYLHNDKELEIWPDYSEIKRILGSIIEAIEERALKERESYSLFRYLKEHAKDRRSEERYIINLFDGFYEILFENVANSPENYDIWEHYFPLKWKVTKSNLEDKNNLISQVSLSEFMRWAQKRIWNPKDEFDKNLDDVSRNLFPEVDPIAWAKILIFSLSSIDPKNRVKYVIERHWNFGCAGRFHTYSGEFVISEEMEKRASEERNTFELATMLFKKDLSKESLEHYIRDLKELEGKYKDDSLEETKRLGFLNIFTKMLDFLSVGNQERK